MFADNYALSQARAQAVADYLAAALNVPAARVHVEGHGSDEPLNAGKDAASLAANRRVEIVIEGARFEANAPLELVKAGGAAAEDRNGGRRAARRRAPRQRAARASRVQPTEPRLAHVIDIEALTPGIRWLTPEADAVAGHRVDQDRDPARAAARRWSSPSTARRSTR